MSLRISHQQAASAIEAESALVAQSNAKPKRTNGHQRPAPISPEALAVDATRIRIRHWLFLLGGLSASAFYVRLAKGEIPQPCGYDGNCMTAKRGRPYWRAAVVRAHLAQ